MSRYDTLEEALDSAPVGMASASPVARAAILLLAQNYGGSVEEQIVDTLTDLLHLAGAMQLESDSEPYELAYRALGHYEHETEK